MCMQPRRNHPGWKVLNAALTGVFLCLLLSGCSLPPRIESGSLADPSTALVADSQLGQALAPALLANPGLTGIQLLGDPHDAFAARVLLARTAEYSLDVQYYIWRKDLTGSLLLNELYQAAERGVRVRLLLDDHGTRGLDQELAALHAHPNIEVRLFNPFVQRHWRLLGFATDFGRLNQRMHNKSFTADRQASILGGRNIGDEYFGATAGILFADLDVLAVGHAAVDVSEDFSRYWYSALAYPADQLLDVPRQDRLQQMEQQAAILLASDAATDYREAIRESDFIHQILSAEPPLLWVPTQLVSDDPGKVLRAASDEGLLLNQLLGQLGTPQHSLFLVSPYFVPTATGTEALVQLAQQGTKVTVLTNAYEATDVGAVHSGYIRHRADLLAGGIILYEMKRQPGHETFAQNINAFGSSGSSLHAKTFVVDQQRIFIGSFNFDPRSANLNTEMGLIIDSPLLAHSMLAGIEQQLPVYTYAVTLDADERLSWQETTPEGVVMHPREPGTSFWSRTWVRLLSWLPLEGLL